MTDLIARLEATDPVTHSDICGCPGWFPPEYTTCRTAALLDNLPAILHALKVQQAAEAYVDHLGAEKEWIHHANLVRAVKGVAAMSLADEVLARHKPEPEGQG